jgi:hypothetical protein
MKALRFVIDGTDLQVLPHILQNGVKSAGAGVTLSLNSWNGVSVLAAQEAYMRIWDYVVTFVVFNLKEKRRCEVQIVVAKGSYALLDFGAEKSAANKIAKILEKVCKENGWKIEGKKELI